MKQVYAIVSKYGEDDFSLWFPELSDKDEEAIMEILAKYESSGYSVRGSGNDIAEELQ